MSRAPQTVTIYSDAEWISGGSIDTPAHALGAPDSVNAGVYAGANWSSDSAYKFWLFSTTPLVIPKYSKITQVLVGSRYGGYAPYKTNQSYACDTQWGVGKGVFGSTYQRQIGSHHFTTSTETFDTGNYTTDITADRTWLRDDFTDVYVYGAAQGSATAGNDIRGYWDFFSLVVTYVHPPDQRMVI